jgi:ubiquinone/menaquinone biosynthesis C-methylase UbiE
MEIIEEPKICMLVDLFGEIIKPNIKDYHLDYGCGEGWITYYASEKCPGKRFIGYDINKRKIKIANKKFKNNNLSFIKSKKQLIKISPFESAGASFVFHENPEKMFQDLNVLLNKKGKICVLDYDLKEKTLEEFEDIFYTKREKQIIRNIGLKQSYKIHTSLGLEDCKKYSRKNCFKSIKSYRLLNKYFVWIGEKTSSQIH